MKWREPHWGSEEVSATGASQRLTEAVDRLLLRLTETTEERDRLASAVTELEHRLEHRSGEGDPEGYKLLRLHSARLLRERQEIKQRLEALLVKLERVDRQ